MCHLAWADLRQATHTLLREAISRLPKKHALKRYEECVFELGVNDTIIIIIIIIIIIALQHSEDLDRVNEEQKLVLNEDEVRDCTVLKDYYG